MEYRNFTKKEAERYNNSLLKLFKPTGRKLFKGDVMKEVTCPGCNMKLGTIDGQRRYITFEKGVKPQQPNVSMGLLIAPFKCPKCGKTSIHTVAI